MGSARVFPMPVWPAERRGLGWCRWCGNQIIWLDGPKFGEVDKRRTWHAACLLEFKLHTWPEVQFNHIEARDGLKCWDCGESPEKWIRDPCETGIGRPWIDVRDRRVEWVGRYHGIGRATALELEHTVPLWKVEHMEPEERRVYFGPENLRLRCPDCHGAKTAREAGERAKSKRLVKEREGKPKRAGPKRKIPSRPFQKRK